MAGGDPEPATENWPAFVAWPVVDPGDCTVFVHRDAYGEHRESDLNWPEDFKKLRDQLLALDPVVPDSETAKPPARRPRLSAAEKLTFRLLRDETDYRARALVCSTACGESVSVTLRSIEDGRGKRVETPDDEHHPPAVAGWPAKEPIPVRSTFAPDGKPNDKYWFTLTQQCDVLASHVFGDLTKPVRKHGLIVLTGATKSGKTEIAYGLTHLYLSALKTLRGRRPHLVTFEDPIERYFAEPVRSVKELRAAAADPSRLPPRDKCKELVQALRKIRNIPKATLARWWGIDYTPRQKGKDVHDLKQAFADALRQTPSVFYIGEVRDPTDWPAILEFAGTGHLVVTTAHAGSLLEAVSKILSAVGARTPAERRQWASKVLSVVHLRSIPKDQAAGRELLLPAVWRQTPQGLAHLTADGLGALVPNFLRGSSDRVSCFGRRYGFERLWTAAGSPEPDAHAILSQLAVSHDLEGV